MRNIKIKILKPVYENKTTVILGNNVATVCKLCGQVMLASSLLTPDGVTCACGKGQLWAERTQDGTYHASTEYDITK